MEKEIISLAILPLLFSCHQLLFSILCLYVNCASVVQEFLNIEVKYILMEVSERITIAYP